VIVKYISMKTKNFLPNFGTPRGPSKKGADFHHIGRKIVRKHPGLYLTGVPTYVESYKLSKKPISEREY
jgi:hypothetical protein